MQLLLIAEFAYNNSVHSIIREILFYTLSRYHPRILLALKDNKPQEGVPAIEDRVKEIIQNQEELLKQ